MKEHNFDQLHVLFAKSCKQYSDEIAIECGERKLSYSDSLDQVLKIKALLEQSKVVQGDIVAVYGGRSIEAVFSSLAISAIGATLMLVDQSVPPERLSHMLNIAKPKIIFHCNKDTTALADIDNIFIGDVKDSYEISVLSNHSNDNAYIAFTSGSTGKPKAIMGSHNGLSHFLSWQKECFSIECGDRFANLTNLSFDVYLRDVFLPIISGATVCIPESQSLGPAYVIDFFESQLITGAHLVPSVANLWINNQSDRQPIQSLKYAFFAGEPLDYVLIDKWHSLFPQANIINLYGPTETTLAKCYFCVEPETRVQSIQPIGEAIPDTSIYILSKNNEVCHVGEEGEICIHTPYRSHGYIENNSHHAPTFIDIEVAGVHVKGLYRTGDIGRKNSQGKIEILGRKDDQVKINGVRIELSEVRLAAIGCPGVRDAFCTTKKTGFSKSIILFIESDNNDAEFYLSRLKPLLPSVAVPSDVIFIPHFPRLPNGKLNRKDLIQRINIPHHSVNEIFSPKPNHSPKEIIKGLWEEILYSSNILETSNFFDVGGNSMAAMVLHERLEKSFSLTFPETYLFQYATIKSQSDFIEKLKESKEVTLNKNEIPNSLKSVSRRRVIGSRFK